MAPLPIYSLFTSAEHLVRGLEAWLPLFQEKVKIVRISHHYMLLLHILAT